MIEDKIIKFPENSFDQLLLEVLNLTKDGSSSSYNAIDLIHAVMNIIVMMFLGTGVLNEAADISEFENIFTNTNQ